MDLAAENEALRKENERLRARAEEAKQLRVRAAESEELLALLAEREQLEGQLRAQLEEKEQLEEQLRAQSEENERLEARLRARLEVSQQVARRLQHEVDLLERLLKGPKSERFIDPDQLPLPLPPKSEQDAPAPDTPPADEPKASQDGDKKPRRRRKNKGRRDISKMNHLDTITHRSVVKVRWCPCGCGAPAESIGEEVTWRLERVPARYIRHKNVQEKVVFPGHREQGVVTAVAQVDYALPKAMCANQLLAHVAVDKYMDHLPLFRQAQRFGREGLELHRSTLSRWMMELGELLRPIVNVLVMEVLSGTWLRADATGMPVLDRSRTKGKAHHGHFWAYGNHDSVVFAYTSNKEATTVAALFEGFQGTVVIDGATDFNLLEKAEAVTRAGCWAHARRYFYEAIKTDSARATTALTTIRLLFMAERTVMSAEVDRRLEIRKELCRPIVDGFKRWVEEELPKVVPRDPIHKALSYVRNQWDRLVVFLDVPTIPCHNNDTERDLRRPVKGKHNYTFAGSPRGARAATTYYTLFGTCLMQGLDPERYLVEILGRLDERPSALTPQAIREQWLPAVATHVPATDSGT